MLTPNIHLWTTAMILQAFQASAYILLPIPGFNTSLLLELTISSGWCQPLTHLYDMDSY